MAVYYMHTLNNKPAYFDGEQVVFVPQYPAARPVPLTAMSLEQLRREQRASAEYRRKHKFQRLANYGYIKIRTPD